jgi:dTDP-4-dehydrorhamnose reductase
LPIAGVDWRALDIRHRDDVTALVQQTRPAVIVNTAFQQPDWATTADGAMHLAVAAAAVGARLVPCLATRCSPAGRNGDDLLARSHHPYGAAKAAAETAIKGLDPAAVIARTSLIIGDGDSTHEAYVHALASGATAGVLFTDDVRCPVHVSDLASALLELAAPRTPESTTSPAPMPSPVTTSAYSSPAATASTRPACQPACVPGPARQAPSTCAWTAP